EPDNPDEWPQQLTDFGFSPIADYYSAVTTELSANDPRLEVTAERLRESGVTIHTLDPARRDEELSRGHALPLPRLRNHFLYTPISLEDFLAQYAPIRPHIRPELVLLAEKEGELIGFAFCIPDLLQAQRGETVDTLILKTLVVRPDHGGLGLGGLLLARAGEV